PRRPRDLAGRTAAGLEPHRLDEEARDEVRFVRAGENGLDLGPGGRGGILLAEARRFANYLPERPVGDPVAVGETAPIEVASLPLDRTEELRRDPRLADTRLAEDRDEAAAPALDRRRELAAQGSELAASPDECRSRVPQPRGATFRDADETVSRDRV